MDESFKNNDVTTDSVFLDFLCNPEINMTEEERERCERLSKYYALRDNELYFYDMDGVKRVPCLSERHHLMIQVHQSLGHCGTASTIRALR